MIKSVYVFCHSVNTFTNDKDLLMDALWALSYISDHCKPQSLIDGYIVNRLIEVLLTETNIKL